MSTLNPAAADFRDTQTAAPRARGWFAEMIQLWLEHNARILAMGGEPL